MKLQLTSIVTLAILYGKVQASPIPAEELQPSASDAILGGLGSVLSTAFQTIAPGAAVKGALNAANACVVQNGQVWCPQRREDESEELLPSASDAILGGLGNVLSTAFQTIAPGAAVNGALNAANACVVQNGQMWCPQRREDESEELLPSASDAILGGLGSLISTAYQTIAPGAAVNGALNAANACVVQNGQMWCPQRREDESEELLPSASDAILGGLGSVLSTAYQTIAPGAAVKGALNAANACVVQNGQVWCPQRREVESEELQPSASDAILGGLGSLLSTAYQTVAPGAAVKGALSAANACVVQNGQVWCPQ